MRMHQALLTNDLQVVRDPAARKKRPVAPVGTAATVARMIGLLEGEEPLAFCTVIPHGSTLKCIAELLMRCAPHVPMAVDAEGLSFVACDPNTGRLIHVILRAHDLVEHQFRREHPLRCTLESGSLHAVFHQLKKRDLVLDRHRQRPGA